MEESVGEIEHIVANFFWNSMRGDIEETHSRARFVDLSGYFLSGS